MCSSDLGASPLSGGESFAVTVNGTTYTTANGLVVSGTNWSLDVPTSMSAGIYEVRSVRTLSTGLDLPDQTHNELVINNAPTLGDTTLSMTVVEDAGAPVGAVGSPISAFTGGIGDVDPSAVKGIAITDAKETNGTWYYTTDGGATWTPINQYNGTVSSSNALLLADDPRTRLYFAPASNFDQNITSALTLRAWDQTRGSIGSKVDTTSAGGVYAFSTQSDVIDVIVTPVNDIPVNTVPSAQSIATSSTLTFSSANGNSISVADVDNSNLTVTLSVGAGTLTLATTSGLTFAAGDGTADASMTFSGTKAAINAAMEGMKFNSPSTAQVDRKSTRLNSSH